MNVFLWTRPVRWRLGPPQSVAPLDPGFAMYSDVDPADHAQADAWLGAPVDYQLVSFNQSSWSEFANSIPWATDLYKDSYNLWSVPLAAQQGTLPAVVAGTHDATFTNAANRILAAAATGQPSNTPILIRTGWEFNLLSQEQRAFDAAGNPTPGVYVDAFRRVVGLFRAVSNRFRFVWCANVGPATENGLTVTDCYPGDGYVDYVGLDIYADVAYTNAGNAGFDGFEFHRTWGAGLDWLASFGAAHGKPVMLNEVGVNSELLWRWLDKIIKWSDANAVVFFGYWNSDAAFPSKVSDGSLPVIGNLIRNRWGVLPAVPQPVAAPLENPTVSPIGTMFHSVTGTAGTDLRLTLNAATMLGPIQANTARRIELIGGNYNYTTERSGWRLLQISEASESVYLDGMKIAMEKANTDAIAAGGTFASPYTNRPNVILKNIRATGVNGTQASPTHADCFQAGYAIARLWIDRFTGSSNYQGIFVPPQKGPFDSIEISRTNILMQPNADSASAFGKALWLFDSEAQMQASSYPIVLHDVWIEPGDKTLAQRMTFFDNNGDNGCTVGSDAISAYVWCSAYPSRFLDRDGKPARVRLWNAATMTDFVPA